MTGLSLSPAALDVFHLEAPLRQPRRNAFGVMRARPALIVRLTDADGTQGWGEVFCNWPSFAAPYRARILHECLAPHLIGRSFATPGALSEALANATRQLALQANEPGPFEQAIAGLDIAAWDLTARRADVPLHAILAPESARPVRAYASALTAETIDRLVPPLRERGWTGFKLKAGFGRDPDLANFERLRRLVGDGAHLMADANQRWAPDQAAIMGRSLGAFALDWLEEPIAADEPPAVWAALRGAVPMPLAAGENIRGDAAFLGMARDGRLGYIQPDAIKWGGLSGLKRVARIARETGATFAPHFLGGGIGLLATAHAAAALGAAWLEVDVTENPLRDDLVADAFAVEDGHARLAEAPGLGPAPSMELLERHAAR